MKPLLAGLGLAGVAMGMAVGVREFDQQAIMGLAALVGLIVLVAITLTLRTAEPWWLVFVLSFLTLPLGEARWAVGPLRVPPATVVFVATLVMVAGQLLAQRRELLGDRRLAAALLAILAGFAVSMVRAQDVEVALWGLGKWGFHVVLFLFLIQMRDASWHRRTVLGLVLVTGLLSAWGLGAYLVGAASEVNFYAGVGTRTATGLHVAVVFPLAVGTALSRATPGFWRIVTWVSMLTAGVAVGFSYSRTAWIAMLAGLLVAVGLSRRRVSFSVVVLAGILFLGVLGPEEIRDRFWSTFSLAESKDLTVTNALRLRLQRLAVERIAENPIVGVGLGNYTSGLPWYLHNPVSPVANIPHNFYLMVWAEGGLASLLGFLAFVGLVLRQMRIGLRSESDERAELQRGALGSVVAIATFIFFSDDFNNTVVWTVLGLAVAGTMVGRARTTAAPRGAAPARVPPDGPGHDGRGLVEAHGRQAG